MNPEELIKNHASKVIEKMLEELIAETHLEISFDYLDQDQWAVVSTHHYKEDKEFSLRLHSNNEWNLALGYYDDEDEFFEVVHVLTTTEQDVIPNGLQILMKKVVDDEKSIRVATSLLKGKM